jgi:nitronate monooxygenase/enoyl-[acyl-carrier protein] reductase II
MTDRPFGLNAIIANLDDPEATDQDKAPLLESIAMAIQERVPLLVLFWGDPSHVVDDAHSGGVKVFVQVGSLEEAKSAASSGVDGIIAQGIEAGGHVRGTTSVWDLIPAVVGAVDPVPVLASGGIGDGAGIARALRFGAQGVSMGTRFVASEEAYAHPLYKQRVVEGSAEDTYYGNLFDVWWPNAPHRVLKNKAFEEWDAAGRPQSGDRPGEDTPIGTLHLPWGPHVQWPRYASGMLIPDFEGDPELAPMWAGESVGVINEVKPAGEIVRDLVREAEAALAENPSH